MNTEQIAKSFGSSSVNGVASEHCAPSRIESKFRLYRISQVRWQSQINGSTEL